MGKYFVVSTFLFAAVSGFPVLAGAADCPVIQPNYDRVCGTANPEFIRPIDEVGGCFIIPVKARSKWNASGIRLLAGKNYSFEVLDQKARWQDATIVTDADGWTPKSQKDLSYFEKLFIGLTEPLRRTANQNWFYLMGMVAEIGEKQFPIGKKTQKPYAVTTSGEFCAYANDLPWMYGNNSGSIKLRVKISDNQK
jgi:hypothetical protein